MAADQPTEINVSGEYAGAEIPNPVTFSAIFNDSVGHEAVKCQVQVNTDQAFTGTMMWDSGLIDIDNVPDGERSEELQYGGYDMTPYETYYARLRFEDDNTDVTPWTAIT